MNCELLSIPGVVGDLLLDPVIVRAFKRTLGKDARRRLDELSDGAPLTPDEQGLLEDTLLNDPRLYVRFTARGGYPIDIVGLGGVYFVKAYDSGNTGLFEDLDDAESYVTDNWDNTLVSPSGRRYRDDFCPPATRRPMKPKQASDRKLNARR